MEVKQKRVLLLVCVTYSLWQIASQWTNTLLQFLYWNTRPGMDVLQISYVQAMGSFCNAIGAFALGQVIDTSGSKSVFCASIVLTAIYYASMSASHSFVSFLLAQMFRIGYHFEAGAEMYLATISSERERTGIMMHLVSIPQAIAFVMGPLLAARFTGWFGLRTAEFCCGAFLLVVVLPLVIWALPDTHDVPKLAAARLQPFDGGLPLLVRNSALREAILLKTMLVAPFICYELVGKQFIMRRYFNGPGDMAMLMCTTGISMFLMQYVVLARFQRKLTPRRTLQLSLVVLAMCYLGIVYARSYQQMLIISGLQSAAYALAYAETCTQLSTSVEVTQLGKATGLASTLLWVTQCVMPLITGQLAMYAHYTYAIYLSVALTALMFGYVTYACECVDNRVKDVLPVIGLLA